MLTISLSGGIPGINTSLVPNIVPASVPVPPPPIALSIAPQPYYRITSVNASGQSREDKKYDPAEMEALFLEMTTKGRTTTTCLKTSIIGGGKCDPRMTSCSAGFSVCTEYAYEPVVSITVESVPVGGMSQVIKVWPAPTSYQTDTTTTTTTPTSTVPNKTPDIVRTTDTAAADKPFYKNGWFLGVTGAVMVTAGYLLLRHR